MAPRRLRGSCAAAAAHGNAAISADASANAGIDAKGFAGAGASGAGAGVHPGERTFRGCHQDESRRSDFYLADPEME